MRGQCGSDAGAARGASRVTIPLHEPTIPCTYTSWQAVELPVDRSIVLDWGDFRPVEVKMLPKLVISFSPQRHLRGGRHRFPEGRCESPCFDISFAWVCESPVHELCCDQADLSARSCSSPGWKQANPWPLGQCSRHEAGWCSSEGWPGRAKSGSATCDKKMHIP